MAVPFVDWWECGDQLRPGCEKSFIYIGISKAGRLELEGSICILHQPLLY